METEDRGLKTVCKKDSHAWLDLDSNPDVFFFSHVDVSNSMPKLQPIC